MKRQGGWLWTMPGWMEPYRHLIKDLGSRTLEEHMNSEIDGGFPLRAITTAGVQGQVTMLGRLHDRGYLAAVPMRASEMAAALDRVRAVVPSRLGADRQIEAHADRGDNAAVIFYAGASWALAHVSQAIRGQ